MINQLLFRGKIINELLAAPAGISVNSDVNNK